MSGSRMPSILRFGPLRTSSFIEFLLYRLYRSGKLAVVFAVKKTEQGTIWVLLLAPQTSAAVKDEIRRYVFKTIEDKMILSINEERKDDTDYAQMDYYNFAAKTKSKSKPSTFSSQPGHNFS